MSGFSFSFDPESIKEIAAFAGFGVLLSEEVQGAMTQGAGILIEAMRADMHWKTGDGTLANSLTQITDSPYEVQVGSDDPKAARRNWGFSGKTDSLGRYYANDPGAFYAEHGMAASSQQILTLMDAAMNKAMSRMGG
jgi:hypothetical protein